MKRKFILPTLFLFSIFFVGCAPKQMYYFGNYSQTLYASEKFQNEESFVNHKQELERIISESEVKNLPVPPGIYAELGYINLKMNNSKEAIRLFQIETQLYPESKHLMDRLIQSAKAKESPDASESDLSKSNDPVSQ
jgi:hypothetical protein